MKSELRKDYIQEKYVIIAPRRGKRPHDISEPTAATANTSCVFCPDQLRNDNVPLLATIGLKNKWQIAVIPNKFPAVSTDNPKVYGRQEVVIETPDHAPELHELPTAHVAQLFDMYAQRTEAISKDKKISYILTFKNDGGAAGASLAHAHSQIFATQFVPAHLEDKSVRTQAYAHKTGRCVYCDVIKKERTSPRFVAEDKHVIVFTPYASMHNYEVWVMPKRHVDNISLTTSAERLSLAKHLKLVLKKICDLDLPYNFYFHQVIRDADQHLYIKVTPRGSVWAGVEIGSGLIINPVAPEDAAKFYRA